MAESRARGKNGAARILWTSKDLTEESCHSVAAPIQILRPMPNLCTAH